MKLKGGVLKVPVVNQGQFGNMHASPACRSLSSLNCLEAIVAAASPQ
jgi:hypothetical protein